MQDIVQTAIQIYHDLRAPVSSQAISDVEAAYKKILPSHTKPFDMDQAFLHFTVMQEVIGHHIETDPSCCLILFGEMCYIYDQSAEIPGKQDRMKEIFQELRHALPLNGLNLKKTPESAKLELFRMAIQPAAKRDKFIAAYLDVEARYHSRFLRIVSSKTL